MKAATVLSWSGEIEMDESFYGGLEMNKHASKRQHQGTGGAGKTAVFGMVEREGRIVAKVVPNTQAATDAARHRANNAPQDGFH
jgi:hypothetical protein